MTVSAQTPVNSSTGNGATTVFPYTFKIIRDADLEVSVDGVTKTLASDYTVSDAGVDSGGNITFLAAPAAGAVVLRRRNMQFLRATDYQNQGDLPSSVLNPDLDAPVLMAQQLQEQVSRSLRGPAGEAWPELPVAADRLDRFPVFDAATGEVELSTVTQTQVASAVAAAYSAGGSTADAVTFLPAGVGAVARSVQSRLRDVVNVKDFGATGDGSTDDTAFIQAAITYAASIRGAVYFPPNVPGQYYKITSALSVPSSMYLWGDSPQAATIMGVGMSASEYIVSIDLTLGSNYFFGIKGLTIRSLDSVPNGLYIKNASYLSVVDSQIYDVKDGITLAGGNTFSNDFNKVVTYNIGGYGVRYTAFAGGGHHSYVNCTFAGGTGLFVDSDSVLDGLTLHGCNFEACQTNSMFIGGNVYGVSISGGRTEGCFGNDFQINPATGKLVGGLSITGVNFTANSAASIPISLGGAGGKVRGFNISGNRVGVGAHTEFVQLNGDGESGVISGNYFADSGAVPSLTPRAGVVIFSNENSAGKCAETWPSLGYGQTWQDLAASRAFGATYTNTTGRPITVAVTQSSSGASSFYIGALVVAYTGEVATLTVVVPPGASYKVDSGAAILTWTELR